MKTLSILIVIVLIALGSYYYSKNASLSNVVIENNSVSVDAGNFVAEFSISQEFRKTYMLFGGGHFTNKNLINPISISGLKIADAKKIYTRYPDFYLCSSAGSSLAQSSTEHLNLIPTDGKVLDELKNSLKEHEKNFAKGAERICISLIGKTLKTKSTEVPGKKANTIYQIPSQPFYLINSSKRVDCKNLLDEASETSDIPGFQPPSGDTLKDTQTKPQETPSSSDTYDPSELFPEIEQVVTVLFETVSDRNIEGVYAMMTEVVNANIPRDELIRSIDTMFGQRMFKEQEQTGYLYGEGTVETAQKGVYREDWVYEYYGTITFTDGSKEETLAVFVEEEGQWKIQYFEIAPLDHHL